MIPGESYKTIRQGEPFVAEFEVDGLDLSSATIEMKLIKPSANPPEISSSTVGSLTKVYASGNTTIKWAVSKTETVTMIGQYEFTMKVNDYTWIKGFWEAVK